jgi:hypothetical protein|tara:strand:- start:15 stop:182 length:168 start_codon:yes stop_codon:yes gene_type:complete
MLGFVRFLALFIVGKTLKVGSGSRTLTCDKLINSQLSYQLTLPTDYKSAAAPVNF